MRLQSLHDAVLQSLSAALPAWTLIKTQRAFRLDEPRCRLLLRFAFVNHVDDFDIVADVGVEHLAGRKTVCIVGSELGNIQGVGQQRWRVDARTDLLDLANRIVSLFHKVGTPFLRRYSDPLEILRILYAGSEEALLISPIRTQWPSQISALESVGYTL
jgi:hypothetical protein